MTEKFTPGPWKILENENVCELYVEDNKGLIVAAACTTVCRSEQANARLIAAAPDGHALWKKHEWSLWDTRWNNWCCPECKALKISGHAPDCKLAAYFKTVEG